MWPAASILIYFILGGIAGRIRGGALKDEISEMGTTHGRLVWAVSVGIVVFAETANLMYGLGFACAAFIGTVHGYLGGKFDLLLPSNRNVKNYAWLTLASMLRVAPMALLSLLTPYPDAFFIAMFAAAAFVPCYLAGNYLNKIYSGIGHTQYGEFLIYGLILAAIGGIL